MDPYTRLTKAWLDNRYRNSFDRDQPNVYCAHEPIHGIGDEHCEPGHARRIVRLFQLLRQVRSAGGRTLLDVGGAEGYFAHLARELFGMTVVSVDLSEEAVRRAAELFAVPGAAVDAAALPFATDSFDVVTCAEVVEHLAEPVPAILELQRVARGTLVLGTEEWHADEADRDAALAERLLRPHGERSVFADRDLEPLFAPLAPRIERQVVPDPSRFGDDRCVDRAALREFLLALAADTLPAAARMGIVVTARKSAAVGPPARSPGDAEIADHLLGFSRQLHLIGAPTPEIALPEGIALRCPRCTALLAARREPACGCGFRATWRNGARSFLCDRPSFAERIDGMLADRGGPAGASQREDLLSLAAKLELPFQVATSWDFADAAQAARWRHADTCRPVAPGRYRVDGPDPWLQHDAVGCTPAEAGIVTVEMAVRLDAPAAYDVAEIRWLVDGQLWLQNDASAGVVVVPDGAMRTYRFVAPTIVRGEVLLSLRFDPLSFGSGEVHLRTLRIDPAAR